MLSVFLCIKTTNEEDVKTLTIVRCRTIIIIRNRTTKGAKDEFTTILL